MDGWNAEQWAERFLWGHLEDATADPDCHLYRFQYYPAQPFLAPVVIALVFSVPEPKAYVRIYGTSEEEPRYRRNDSLLLTCGQVSSFLTLVQNRGFWNLPEEEEEEDLGTLEILPMIGRSEHWIIEGVHTGCYYKVHRDSPSKGPIFELGNAFWDLASIFHYPYR